MRTVGPGLLTALIDSLILKLPDLALSGTLFIWNG
jgi:hypothetical protein